jgi:hypothetical protein
LLSDVLSHRLDHIELVVLNFHSEISLDAACDVDR